MKTRSLFIFVFVLLTSRLAFAGSATWNLNPISGNWNRAANWTPATVPNGPADVATFDVSNTIDLTFSATSVEVSSIVFNPGASSFNIALDPSYSFSSLILRGAGIINNSDVTQNLTAAASRKGGGSGIEFLNAATAGDLTLLTVAGARAAAAIGGVVSFSDTATAGSATITVDGARAGLDAYGGRVIFDGNSTAGNASFTIGGSVHSGGISAVVQFSGSSSAADADFVVEAANSEPTGNGGELDFIGQATAENATIFVQGGSGTSPSPAYLNFLDTSSIANAVITVGGGDGEGALAANTTIDDTVTIGNATLIANGGTDGGKPALLGFSQLGDATLIANGGNNGDGGLITFDQIGAGTLIANGGSNSGAGGSIGIGSAEAARAEVFGNGTLLMASYATIGSLEGDGIVLLSGQLMAGTYNL